jgi:hypothetical protein
MHQLRNPVMSFLPNHALDKNSLWSQPNGITRRTKRNGAGLWLAEKSSQTKIQDEK